VSLAIVDHLNIPYLTTWQRIEVDPETGEVYQPAIKANATMTLALPKKGLKFQTSNVVGELYLADIGVPPGLYNHPSLQLHVGPIFNQAQIIRLV
jgi:NAD(P)H-hydrate epimerase